MSHRVLLAGLGCWVAALAAPMPAIAQELSASAGFGASALEDCPSDLRYLNQIFGWQISLSCCRSRGRLPKLTPPFLRTQLG
jgi:hypothetical protein